MAMLEGAGTINSPGYCSFLRYVTPGGKVPGSIPQGIVIRQGKPFYELGTSPTCITGETWLINTNFLWPVSLLPKDTGEYPLEVAESVVAVSLLVSCFFPVSLLSRPSSAS
jgi:hypothetical protein